MSTRGLPALPLVVLILLLAALPAPGPAGAEVGDVHTTPESAGSTGLDPSIAIDGNGNPVVLYQTGSELRLLVCDDPVVRRRR